MQKSFVTTVNAWRFERPLAITLAASAMFMVMAVPPSRFSALPGLAVFPVFQPVLALMVGLMFGVAGFVAMSYPWPRLAAPVPEPEEELIPDDEQGQFAASEVSLRLRRADRHPDAPVRAPIFASRDLGSPFMEVGAFAPPPSDEPAEDARHDAIPDGDYAEIDHAEIDQVESDHAGAEPVPAALSAPDAVEPLAHESVAETAHDAIVTEPAVEAAAESAFEPEPVAVGHDAAPVAIQPESEPLAVVEPEWPIPEVPAPIAAFAPEDEPAPAPARSPRQSISAMMDRLSSGLERRAAHGDGDPLPQDRAPALREALDELNRLAARRG